MIHPNIQFIHLLYRHSAVTQLYARKQIVYRGLIWTRIQAIKQCTYANEFHNTTQKLQSAKLFEESKTNLLFPYALKFCPIVIGRRPSNVFITVKWKRCAQSSNSFAIVNISMFKNYFHFSTLTLSNTGSKKL